MNDLLDLTRTLFATGWIYLCMAAAVALALLLFDRGGRPRSPEGGPPPGPAGASKRIEPAPHDLRVHADRVAGDPLRRDPGAPFTVADDRRLSRARHAAGPPAGSVK